MRRRALLQSGEIDYSQQYLTIVSQGDSNTIKWTAANSNLLKTISISTDNGETWTSKISSTDGTTLATLNTGDKMLIKGSETAYCEYDYYNRFASTGDYSVEGNIMSLLFGDNFIGQTSLSGHNYAFGYLFGWSTRLKDASLLVLPATTLAIYCYYNMFFGCSSLMTAPELHATTLNEGCYQRMFRNCSSLTTAPELPATTLANMCYSRMFQECSRLISAPELPATTMINKCYEYMFYKCTSLTTAPELPATTLAAYCYTQMFYNCSKLNSITCLATNISASNCTKNWVSGVASSGTFTKAASMTSWTTGVNGVPSGWTVETASS